jgi:hypothetical protein
VCPLNGHLRLGVGTSQRGGDPFLLAFIERRESEA